MHSQGKPDPDRGEENSLPNGLFVGRSKELALLADLSEEAGAGRSRIVAICGEAGIGKTSLARATAERA
jgi:predicted ATPase